MTNDTEAKIDGRSKEARMAKAAGGSDKASSIARAEARAREIRGNMPDGGAAPGTVIYVPRSIYTQINIAAKDKNNVNYTPDNVWGGNIVTFRGVPVRLAEGIDETETAVS